MNRARSIALLAALALLTLSGAPVAASPAGVLELHTSLAVVGRPQAVQPALDAPPAPCNDGAYNLSAGRWTKTLKWSYRAASTPAGLARSSVIAVLQRSYANIFDARNDCGLPDRVDASATYLGTTKAKPSCRSTDGRNVVGFRALPDGVLARTCWWVSNGRIVEADIQLNNIYAWATALEGCRFQPMLEAVMTHEVGHAFGVGHVGEKKHGRLTMSTRLDGDCNNQEATLGLGDVRALQKLY